MADPVQAPWREGKMPPQQNQVPSGAPVQIHPCLPLPAEGKRSWGRWQGDTEEAKPSPSSSRIGAFLHVCYYLSMRMCVCVCFCVYMLCPCVSKCVFACADLWTQLMIPEWFRKDFQLSISVLYLHMRPG